MFYVRTKYKVYKCEKYCVERRLNGDYILDDITHVPMKDVLRVTKTLKAACDGVLIKYTDGVIETYAKTEAKRLKSVFNISKDEDIEKQRLFIETDSGLTYVAKPVGKKWEII